MLRRKNVPLDHPTKVVGVVGPVGPALRVELFLAGLKSSRTGGSDGGAMFFELRVLLTSSRAVVEVLRRVSLGPKRCKV